MTKRLAGLLSAYLVLSACGQDSKSQPSLGKADVTPSQAEEAFRIIGAIDYLPFDSIENGCYARSLYMSMELAAHEIPSSALYIYGELHPRPGIVWTFHVAPLLKVDGQEPWILDPSFQSSPLKLSKWIAKNKAGGEYFTEIKAGSAYFDEAGGSSASTQDLMIRNFDEMPPFLASDIISACNAMFHYLEVQYPSPALAEAKQRKLMARTRELLDRLNALGKLDRNDSANEKGDCSLSAAPF